MADKTLPRMRHKPTGAICTVLYTCEDGRLFCSFGERCNPFTFVNPAELEPAEGGDVQADAPRKKSPVRPDGSANLVRSTPAPAGAPYGSTEVELFAADLVCLTPAQLRAECIRLYEDLDAARGVITRLQGN